MKYISLFSGIGGFDLAADRAGMQCVLQVEKDRHCLDVLACHWPDVERKTDVKEVKALPTVDLVCGGFPCQDLSVAGRRAGLVGERSGLWFEFHRLIAGAIPRWIVIENVPGLLSSQGGLDFATLLRGLAECGYGVAWRILDAQYFGMAQRRRRVFIVGSLGDGRAAQVLFEREGGAWDSPPRREAGEDAAATIGADAPSRRNGGSSPTEGHLIANPLGAKANGWRGDLDAGNNHLIAFDWQSGGDVRLNISDKPSALQANQVPAIAQSTGVRRLTPAECEKLQGFPPGWTNDPPQSDSVRYRQLGNAVCVPVAEWLFKRICATSAAG